MAKWKYAYPVIQENVSADIMGWPAVPDYETVFGKLKEMGYEGIELQARDFGAVDAGRLGAALEKHGLKVTNLYIAQVKRESGIVERENYNLPKTEGNRVPNCSQDKREAIIDAFRHFKMI